MAVLETIRVKLGIFITVVIAIALLSFIIDPTTLSSVSQSMSSKYDVGVINGKKISYQDFQSDVETFNQVAEMVSGAAASSEQQDQINNAAWQSLIDKYLFVKNAKAAGLTVGEEEMVELTTGDMLSPLVANDPVFVDENGTFSRERLISFVSNMDMDLSGRVKTYWNYLQNAVLSQQYYAKYGSLFSAGNFSNALMTANAVEENNTTSSVDFVMVPFGFTADSTIVVSDKEILNYYKKHQDMYKQQASRDIEYVVFEVVPSAEDIAQTSSDITAVYDEFASTDNMKSFLLKNSDRQLSGYWYSAGELATVSQELSDFVDGASVGAVSPIISKDVTFYAAKVLGSKMMPDQIDVKVIPMGNKEVSDSLRNVLNGSEPMQFTQSYLIPGCESLFDAKVGEEVVVETAMYGKLLAKVVSKSELVAKKQVAILEKESLASKETFNQYYAKANNLATKAAGSYDAYKAAVQEDGLLSTPMEKMPESQKTLGTVDNTKEITRWAFEQKKAGVASSIITVNNNYFYVVALTGIHKEGFTPVNEVSTAIKMKLYQEKLYQKKLDEVNAKIEGLNDMQAIADALQSTVSHNDEVSFSAYNGQALDNKFIGAVASAQEGAVKSVAGTVGVYVFKVLGRETGSFFSEADAKRYEAQKANYSAQMLLPVMMDDADVVDHRARFF